MSTSLLPKRIPPDTILIVLHVGWTLASQILRKQDSKHYDVLNIKLKNGEERSYYFDINKFFGQH